MNNHYNMLLSLVIVFLFEGLCSQQLLNADPVSATIRVTAYRGTGPNIDNVGFPYIDLKNTSVSATIVDYKITIGDTSAFWDAAKINTSSEIFPFQVTIVSPEDILDNQYATDDTIHMTFEPDVFFPDFTLSHRNDIDLDINEGAPGEVYTEGSREATDFRYILFDLDGSDSSDNALITLVFSDGQIISQHLPDFSSLDEDPTLIGTSTHNFPTITLDQLLVTGDADFDNDGEVDGEDFLIWQRNVGVGSTHEMGDANGDSMVNGEDLAVWEGQYGSVGGLSGLVVSTPEPSSGVLSGLALLGVALLRRNHQRTFVRHLRMATCGMTQ
jgi:hypothetical protein